MGISLLAASAISFGEDMTSRQGGVALPVGQWTEVCPGTKCGGTQPNVVGFDNLIYVPAIKRACMLTSYKEITSEQNRTLWCYSLSENRWDIFSMGGSFHDDQALYGGHPDNELAVDPTTSLIYYTNANGAGSSASETSLLTWIFDPIGQSGRVVDQLSKANTNGSESSDIVDYTQGIDYRIGSGGSSPYNILTNTYGSLTCTSGANCPSTALREACAVWSTKNQTEYVFGGLSGATMQNSVYSNYQGNWSSVTVVGSSPTIRAWPTCAYDAPANNLLVAGGCTFPCNVTGTTMSDMWSLSLDSFTWTQYTSTVAPNPIFPTFSRMAYFPEDDAFVQVVQPTSGNHQTWVYRINQGQPAGYKVVSSSAYVVLTGGFNRNSAGWARNPDIQTTSSTVLLAWTETGLPADGTNSGYLHPYAQQFSSPTWTNLGSAYNSISPLTNNATQVVSDVSCVYVGTAPWCSWHAFNANIQEQVWSSGWNGSAWNINSGNYYGPRETFAGLASIPTPATGLIAQIVDASAPGTCAAGGQSIAFCAWDGASWVSTTTTPGVVGFQSSAWTTGSWQGLNQGQTAMANVSGAPTIVYKEQNRIDGIPYNELVQVQQFNGTSWNTSLGGTALNRLVTSTSTLQTLAESVAIVSTGTQPCVAWTEYTAAQTQVTDTAPQSFVDCYNGSSWVQWGSNANATSSDSAYSIGIAWANNQPYISVVERAAGGTQNLFVRTSTSPTGSWATLGNGTNNCTPASSCMMDLDTKAGWVGQASIVSDSTNVFVAWTEQGNDAPWVSPQTTLPGSAGQRNHVYVVEISSTGTETRLGGALNSDTARGSAAHASIAMQNGIPIVSWDELSIGSMRQIYAKQWSGTDWQAVGTASSTTPAPPPSLSNISPSSATAGSGQLTLTASGSNFVTGATVTWTNGSTTNLVTTFVNSTSLTAIITSGLLATSGSSQVGVTNPDSQQSGTQLFIIVSTLAPAGLTGTGVGISSISWTWNLISGATGYSLFYATSTASLAGTATATPFFETNLSTNTGYGLIIRSLGPAFQSALSGAATGFTLAATPGIPVFTSVSSFSFVATWSTNTNPSGTLYQLSDSTDSTFATAISTPIHFSAGFTGNTTNVVNLLASTTYYVRIKSRNSDPVTPIDTSYSVVGSTRTQDAPSIPPAIPGFPTTILNGSNLFKGKNFLE